MKKVIIIVCHSLMYTFLYLNIYAQKDTIKDNFQIEGEIICNLLYKQGYEKRINPGEGLYIPNMKFINNTNSLFSAFVFENLVIEQGIKGVKLLMLVDDTVSLLDQSNEYSLEHCQEPVFDSSNYKYEQMVKFGTWEITTKYLHGQCLDTYFSNLKIKGKKGNVFFEKISNFRIYELKENLIIVATEFCQSRMKILLVAN